MTGKPLRQLDASFQTPCTDQAGTHRYDNQTSISSNRTNNEDSSTSSRLVPNQSSSTQSVHQTTNTETSTTQESSIKDLKAAVENIQKLFSIHLMESEQDSNDDT